MCSESHLEGSSKQGFEGRDELGVVVRETA